MTGRLVHPDMGTATAHAMARNIRLASEPPLTGGELMRRSMERHARETVGLPPTPPPDVRRDYRPGTGPVRGLVVGLPVALLLWLPLAGLGWWLW